MSYAGNNGEQNPESPQVPAKWSAGNMEYVLRATTFTVFFSVQNYLVAMNKCSARGNTKFGCGAQWNLDIGHAQWFA